MHHNFPYSPFIAFENGLKPRKVVEAASEGASSLDYLGQSSLGELHWNDKVTSMGIVCGATVGETTAIVQRLMASHMREPTAELLVFHTDHFPVIETHCPLIYSLWPTPRISVSPNATEKLINVYDSTGHSALPVSFTDTTVTLRHIIAFFTPPKDMQGASTILGTVQLILSQLREPFDLQQFIELVDQEKWSDDGANFVALRQTLLTKLLSAPSEDPRDGKSSQMTVLDLSDPMLQSTGLDSAIMDMALYEFVQTASGKKMIVLSNSQEYLSTTSGLMKTLEALASAGGTRPGHVIMSTTDPSAIPTQILNGLDYAIFSSSRSLLWNEYLQKHFTKVSVPKAQSSFGRATIWSPGSRIASKGDPEKDLWNDRLAWIDVEQFNESMPLVPAPGSLSNDTLVNGMRSDDTEAERMETVEPSVSMASSTDMSISEEEEEGMVALGAFMNEVDLPTPTADIGIYPEQVNQSAAQPLPNLETRWILPNHAASGPLPPNMTKFEPLLTALSQLCDGEVGILVDFEAVRKQTGKREEIRKLGWTTFTQYVKSACALNLVDLVETAPDAKFLTLLPQPPAFIPPVKPFQVTPIQETRNASAKESPGGVSNQALYPEKYAVLMSTILQAGGGTTNVKVPLSAVRSQIGEEIISQTMLRHGWATFGQWIQGACLDNFIRQGGSGSSMWAMINSEALADTPRHGEHGSEASEDETAENATLKIDGTFTAHIPQSVPSSVPPSGEHRTDDTVPSDRKSTTPSGISALDYPFTHRPVVSAVLKLTGAKLGERVPMSDLSASLRTDFPRATDGVLLGLVSKAEQDEVLKCESDQDGVQWASLQNPKGPVAPSTTPSPLPSTGAQRKPVTNAPPDEEPSEQRNLNALDFPTQHHAVVSTLLTKTGGVFGVKVRLVDLADALKLNYPSKEDNFVFELLLEAEKDGVFKRESDEAGFYWISLQYPSQPSASSTPSSSPNPIEAQSSLPPPKPAPSPAPSVSKLEIEGFPLKHRAVVSVMLRLTNGIRGAKVRMTDITGGLKQEFRGAKPDYLFTLVTKAEEDGTMRRETDRAGLLWVYLVPPSVSPLAPGPEIRNAEPEGPMSGGSETLPKPSEPDSNSRTRGSESSLRSDLLDGYPTLHRPLVSAILTLTHGRCHVRLQMESVIRKVMTEASTGSRDAAVVASLIFQASNSKTVQCGQENGTWWTSLEEPRLGPQVLRDMDSNGGEAREIPLVHPDILHPSVFTPLLVVLRSLKGQASSDVRGAGAVAPRVLKLEPTVLRMAGCSSMSEYFDLADSANVTWSVGSGPQRRIWPRNG